MLVVVGLLRRDKLHRLQTRLRRVRDDFDVAAAQALSLREEADDLQLRALASERPDDRASADEAERHARAAEAARDRAQAELNRLRQEIDTELDRRGHDQGM